MLRALESPMTAAPPADPLAALVRSASRGDAGAVRELLDAVAPAVVSTVDRALGHDHPDRDDMAQEALIALLRSLPGFRYECSVTHFARRVAIRVISSTLRNRRAARRSEGATKLDPDVGESTESPLSSPLAQTLAQRRMDLFRQVIADLPPVLAETLALKVVLGHSVEEIADVTQSNINTVRSRLQTAKQTLRDRIASDRRLAELREQNREEWE